MYKMESPSLDDIETTFIGNKEEEKANSDRFQIEVREKAR